MAENIKYPEDADKVLGKFSRKLRPRTLAQALSKFRPRSGDSTINRPTVGRFGVQLWADLGPNASDFRLQPPDFGQICQGWPKLGDLRPASWPTSAKFRPKLGDFVRILVELGPHQPRFSPPSANLLAESGLDLRSRGNFWTASAVAERAGIAGGNVRAWALAKARTSSLAKARTS